MIGTAFTVIVILGLYLNNISKNNNTIEIGALYPLTGGLATYGEPAQKMARMVADEVNMSGGIHGKTLVINFQDHKCSPKEAIAGFQQLNKANGVKIFTSVACTGTMLSIAPMLNSGNALFLSTVISGGKLTGVSPYVFRNWASDVKEGNLFAEEIKKANYKKVGAIYEETDYAKGIKLSTENYLKGSGVVMISESFTSDTKDVRTQLLKLKFENVDVLLISPQTVTSAEVVLKAMEEINFKPKLLLNDNVTISKDLVTKHKNILEGAYGANYTVVQNKKVDDVLKMYKEAYGMDCPQPTVCVEVYNTIHLLVEAISENGNSVAGVKSYLNKVNYTGVTGQISFDSKNDRANTEYSLFIVKDGKVNLSK